MNYGINKIIVDAVDTMGDPWQSTELHKVHNHIRGEGTLRRATFVDFNMACANLLKEIVSGLGR